MVTATALEARSVRRVAPHLKIVETGIGLSRVRSHSFGPIVISCGLAGGLRQDLATGTVVVPEFVTGPSGDTTACDIEISGALVSAANRLGCEVERGALLTTDHVITGDERRTWADRDYVAADMETGLIAATRLAAVRVVLDAPSREISSAWLHPVSALLHPGRWGELVWLMRHAPRCARLAAQVLAGALGTVA